MKYLGRPLLFSAIIGLSLLGQTPKLLAQTESATTAPAPAPAPAMAPVAVAGGSSEPLEITADQTLEWLRGENRFIARGNAMAKQGDTTVTAAVLIADYHETETDGFKIHTLTARDNVTITSPGNAASGDEAVYELDKGLAVMTGSNLTLTSPGQTVTARDRFEYHVESGLLTAIGAAHVQRDTDALKADRVSAYFQKDKTGKNQLTRLEAHNNVVITTPTETLYGNNGIYRAATQIAEVTGDVRIERGPNILEGNRAEVNLATNISKIYADTVPGGRVRGVFYPESKTEPEPDSPQP